MAEEEKWEDLNIFRMSDEDAWTLMDKVKGCAVSWARRDGQTISVWVSHAVMDGELYVTTTDDRPKTKAWLRDPRTSATFGLPGMGSVTVLGRVQLSKDPALRTRFLRDLLRRLEIPAAGEEQWMEAMDTEGRMVGKVEIEKFITFDERKLPTNE